MNTAFIGGVFIRAIHFLIRAITYQVFPTKAINFVKYFSVSKIALSSLGFIVLNCILSVLNSIYSAWIHEITLL